MLTPCEEPITKTLSLTHSSQWYLTNSLILIGIGLGPLILAPLSEVYGRRPVLLGGSTFFIVWNTAGGGVRAIDQLLAFRALSGFGACVADALAGGIIGELWAVEERGRAFAVFMAAPLLGPALGPILGAFIAQGADWRWVFWATSAAAATVLVTAFLFLQETFVPRIERNWLKKQHESPTNNTMTLNDALKTVSPQAHHHPHPVSLSAFRQPSPPGDQETVSIQHQRHVF
jgi:MFS family permease